MRGAVIVAVVLATGGAVSAHPLRAYISDDGIEVIESQIPTVLSEPLEVPTLSDQFLCTEIEQRDTTLSLDVHAAELTLLSSNAVRVELSFAAVATGELNLDNAFFCIGNTTCDDQFSISAAHAVIVLEPIQMSGAAMLGVRSLELDIDESNVTADFSGCALGDNATELLNVLPGLVRQSLVEGVSTWVEDQLGAELAGMLDRMLGDFESMQALPGGIALPEVDFTIGHIEIDRDGVSIEADIDLSTTGEIDSCAGPSPPEPVDAEGEPVPLATAAQVSVSVNYGLVDDAVGHAWTTGLFCVDGDALAGLGVEIDYELISRALPAFPPGTEFSLSARLQSPPSIRSGGQPSRVSVALSGVEVVLHADEPGGGHDQLSAVADVTAIGDIGLDPISSALTVRVVDVQLGRVTVDAGELDFDAARIEWVLERVVVPKLLDDMGELPVTGAVVSLDDYALIVRDLSADDAYVSVSADLFAIPERDDRAPDTFIDDAPATMMSPKTALVRVSGADPEIPAELLRYEVSVDGVARAPTHFRAHRIGEMGKTGTYQVEVRAVDLSGNRDSTPATATVMVDGKAPKLAIVGERTQRVGPGTRTVRWTASDDITPEAQLGSRVEIHKLRDRTDPYSHQLLDTRVLPAGVTSVEVEATSPGIYRIDVYAIDAVGNESVASALIDVDDGGCSATGSAPSAWWLMLCLAVLALRRRRAI